MFPPKPGDRDWADPKTAERADRREVMAMNVPPLDMEEQRRLLRWVRQTIDAAVRGDAPPNLPEAELTEALRSPHGAFVTLKKRGELRGCIGKMDFDRPLIQNAIGAASASALEDPRFPPVTTDELADLHVEISILNPPEDLPNVTLFDPQRHGIIIEKGWHHALLLPKVAQEQNWDAE